MSDPTRAPAGWYEDGSGGRRYWDGEAWTQYVAPAASGEPGSQVGVESGSTEATDAAATQPVGATGPTIPFVWGSGGSDAAGSGYGGGAGGSSGWWDASGANPADATTVPFETVSAAPAAGPTSVLPQHPFTEPSNPGPNVVGIIALIVAVTGLVFVFIPALSGVAWTLVLVAFVLSLIGLSLRGAKWAAITGLVVSIIAAIVGIVMLVMLLFGWIGDVVAGVEDAVPDVPVPVFPVPEVPGADDPNADDSAVAGNLRFGETMTWDDGVALTVSVPEPYTPSDFAVGATRATSVVFTLTLTNNSTGELQPLPLPTLTAGDQEVSEIFDVGAEVFDPADDVGFPPTATIEPGGSVSWRVAWSLDDSSSLTMEAAPNLLYPSATFTNAP
ncbi:hypothetical protein J2X63_002091 [Agromyces sp. 3263]|uniref:DUF2510 domain-containing protein n=1 Tax=Agromyces sp. 3263 TaxID=2817750 RepID=UPI00285D44AE|nr:DUF2510 domain-containing protein [Agromyces sp. 3263]MDR6906405.1 hypothetical protein [Agromyces sp. 3263]